MNQRLQLLNLHVARVDLLDVDGRLRVHFVVGLEQLHGVDVGRFQVVFKLLDAVQQQLWSLLGRRVFDFQELCFGHQV